MKKPLIWTAIVFVLILMIWNIADNHVRGVKSEKEWFLTQLKFDFSAKLDSAEKPGQALLNVTHGQIDVAQESRVKEKLRFNGWVDLFIYRPDEKLDLMITGPAELKKGDSVYVNTDLKTAQFFRDGVMIYEQPLYKSLRGRPF